MKKLCCTKNSWLCFKHLMQCKKYCLVLLLHKKIFLNVKRFNIILVRTQLLSSEIIVLTNVDLIILTFVSVNLNKNGMKVTKTLTKIGKELIFRLKKNVLVQFIFLQIEVRKTKQNRFCFSY